MTDYFNLPRDWIGTISADCSNTEYGSDYFGVKLFYTASYGQTYDLIANEIPKPRWSTTFATYGAAGGAYITVDTDCAWSIRIVGR